MSPWICLLLLCHVQLSVASSSSSRQHSDDHVPSIILWPNHSKVPGERPGIIGDESMDCLTKNTNITNCLDRRTSNVTIPMLMPFRVPSSDAAVVIAPGGGYQYLAIDRSGTDIAHWLNSIGISAFILKYRVPERRWLSFGRAPLMDAQRAMGIIQNMAENPSSYLPKLNSSKILA